MMIIRKIDKKKSLTVMLQLNKSVEVICLMTSKSSGLVENLIISIENVSLVSIILNCPTKIVGRVILTYGLFSLLDQENSPKFTEQRMSFEHYKYKFQSS